MIRLGEVPSMVRCSASWRAVALSGVPQRKSERPKEGASGVPEYKRFTGASSYVVRW